MAKRTINENFINGIFEKNENGEFILTEITKDDEKVYNISKILEALVGQDNVSMTFKNVSELKPNDK